MKKQKIMTTVLVALIFCSSISLAQIDDKRMERDIRIASNILKTLANDENNYFYSSSQSNEGSYIEGYGVIFRVNQGFSIQYAPKIKIKSRGRQSISVIPRDDSEAIVELESGGDERALSYAYGGGESLDWQEIFTIFLADYGQLIGQLKPTDKIILTSATTHGPAAAFLSWTSTTSTEGDNEVSHGITAELLKKDQMAYSSGKISREELVKRIKIKESDHTNRRSKDLDIFAATIKTIYDADYTDSYFISWEPSYEKIDGVGVVFSFKVYSSYDEDGSYFMPGIQKRGLSPDERNQKVKELYPLFVKGFKENLVNYGRSIKSLNNDEVVIARVTMTKCEGCSLPKKVEFSVRASVLKNFNSGKIKLSEAVDQVNTTEN